MVAQVTKKLRKCLLLYRILLCASCILTSNFACIATSFHLSRSNTGFVCCYDTLVQLCLLTYVAHGLLGGQLLALLLGVTESRTRFYSLYAHSAAEGGAVGSYNVLAHQLEYHLVLHLLAPLNETALEVVVLLGYFLEIDVLADDALLEETIAVGIATVEIDGSYQCLEGVARDEAVVCTVDMGRLYEFYQSSLLGYAVETAALHYLATHRSEESLLLPWEMVVQDIAHHGFDDSIAQIFEAFIVFLLFVRAVVVERTVYQRFVVYGNVAGVEPENFAQTTGKGLVLTAQQVMDIVGQMVYMHGIYNMYRVTITKKAV